MFLQLECAYLTLKKAKIKTTYRNVVIQLPITIHELNRTSKKFPSIIMVCAKNIMVMPGSMDLKILQQKKPNAAFPYAFSLVRIAYVRINN